MARYFTRKVAIEKCYTYLTSNYSMEEIQRMSLFELCNTKDDFVYYFLSPNKEWPSRDIVHEMRNEDSFKKYIGYVLFKSDNIAWILMEKSSCMRTDRLAISSDGKLLEFREN